MVREARRLERQDHVWIGARVVLAIALLTGCSVEPWRQLELGDVLLVRGRQLLVHGSDALAGSVGWGVDVTVPHQLPAYQVRRARFGVGTAAVWTLQGRATDAATWPDELEVASATWHVAIDAEGHLTRHTFELPVGQRLMRSVPCEADLCSYEFALEDAHRDVFTLEAVYGRDETLDAWLDALRGGLIVTIRVGLHVNVRFRGGPGPDHVFAALPMAPSGASLEFRP
jgi:hypothetical protein